MSSNIMRLRNKTAVEQSIFVNNRRIVLEPKAEKDFEESVANAFLQVCDGLVELVEAAVEIGHADAHESSELVWLANLTGDPDAPKTVKRKKKLARGESELVEIPNPMAEASDVVRFMDGGMREYDTADGPLADNLGKVEIRIPKYSRRQFPKVVANWCLQRDANNGWISPYHRSWIAKSRPRSNFEPDMTWELDDMRCYLFMIDRAAKLGPSEMEVIQAAEKADEDLTDAIKRAKELCMKRLHFRLAKPEFRLITKPEYEGFRDEFEKPAKSASAPAVSSASSARA